jgi:hypothetical protein
VRAGIVCRMGESPVIGIALDAKASEHVGTVKTLCFVGLNAMTRHCENYKELFNKSVSFQSRSVDEFPLSIIFILGLVS